MTLPIHDPVLIFSIVMIIVLIAPLLVEKIRLPGIAGLIFAGVIIGPHLFGILERDKTIELLGTIGLLYIMFQAGLEINLEQVKQNKHYSMIFGLLTFFIPLIIGTLAGYFLIKLNILASILLASMFSSHTLITYPIVSKMGLSKNRSVAPTIGGTIITDSLAFIVLAVIIASNSGELTFIFWAKLFAATTVYSLATIFLFPRIGSWFFKRFSSESGIEEYAFVITALFISAYLSHLAGLEPIIGAFLAGLTLNSLIPERSVLMNRIQFVGNALFIPFFLISVGMLINPAVFFTDSTALIVSAVMIIVAIFSKLFAAQIFSKMVRFTKNEQGLVFGMSVNQAAATLAAVMVGVRVGIFNDKVLTGTIMMIVVTCFLGSIVTQKYTKKLIAGSKESKDFTSENLAERILIPISNPEHVNCLMDLAFLLHPKNSHEPLYSLYVAMEGVNEEEKIIEGETILTKASVRASSIQKQMIPLIKIDTNVANAIKKAVNEQRISKIIMGCNDNEKYYSFFETVTEQFVRTNRKMLLIPRLIHPLNLQKRILLIVPPLINRQNGFMDTFVSLKKLSSEINAEIHIVSEETTYEEISELAITKSTHFQFTAVKSWRKIEQDINEIITPSDLLIQMISPPNMAAWRLFFDKLSFRIRQVFPHNNYIAVYPYCYTEEDYQIKSIFSKELTLLKTIPAENFFINAGYQEPEKVFQNIIQKGNFSNKKLIYKQLLTVLKEYPIELSEDIVLIHIHTPQVKDFQIYFSSNKAGFEIKKLNIQPKLVITLLSPEELPVQKHLGILTEISKMVMVEEFEKNIIAADDYPGFISLISNSVAEE